MIVQSIFGSGQGIVWLLMVVGFFIYGRVDVASVASGRNGVQMETMLGKVYALFAIQLAVGVTLVVFPIVMIVLKVHWFFIIANTLMTLSICLATLLMIRDIATMVGDLTVEREKEKGKKRIFVQESWYTGYRVVSWVWVLTGVGMFVWGQIAIGKAELSLVSDVGIWVSVIGYLLVYMVINRQTVRKVSEGLKMEASKNIT